MLNSVNKSLKEEILFTLYIQYLREFPLLSKFEEFSILLTNIMKEDIINPRDNIFSVNLTIN